MDSPQENAHPRMTTRANPQRVQLEQLLESGVTSVNQWNGYKRGYPLYT